MEKVTCPYCKNGAKFVTGKEIFPKTEKLHKDNMWFCKPCMAFAKCHQKDNHAYGRKGVEPMGQLANVPLWRKRSEAIRAFRHYRRDHRYIRKEGYGWLSYYMDMELNQFQVMNFSEEDCDKVFAFCNTDHKIKRIKNV